MTSCSFFGGIETKNKKRKKERKHFPGQEMPVVLQGFSRRKTTHYLRARQAATATTSGEDQQETARR